MFHIGRYLMKRKLMIFPIILVCIYALLCACNDTTPDFTDSGFSVSGKIVVYDLPEGVDVKIDIFVNNVLVDTIGNKELFSLNNLKNGDTITFNANNVKFYPDKHTVTANLYDLRVDGYYTAS